MLTKKMLRDLRENKGAYIACISIIVIGLMIFTSFSMVMDNLILSQESFYLQQNFADGFADVQSMPYQEVKKLSKLSGIQDIQGRLIKDVRVLFPNGEENVYLRLISLDLKEEILINEPLLEEGEFLKIGEQSLWLDNKFFEANQLTLNTPIEFIAEGKKRSLKIAGTAKNPEFIYALRTTSDLYPTPETFGIAYVPLEVMKNLFQEGNHINNLVFNFETGTDYETVEEKLKIELKPYGLKNIYPRKDQISHMLLTQELQQLEATARTVPIIFLAVAAMILYIMLKRMVEQQRGQIGILKALGYTTQEILVHYLSYALTIGGIGGILGGLLGIALSFPYTSMYQLFFNMPGLNSEFSFGYFFFSVLLSLVFAAFAGYQGSKTVLSLQPAEAMRPPAPPIIKEIFIEKIAFFWNMLTVQGKMATRNMSRHWGRTIFIFLGIMFTYALLCLPWTMKDMIDKMIFNQYEKVQTYDLKIPLASPLAEKQVRAELNRFPGVKKVEAVTEVPVTLNHNWLKKDVPVLGVEKNSTLYNILDENDHKKEPPENGILLSQRLAQLLNAEVGTQLTVKSPLMKDSQTEKSIEVVGIIPQYLGLNAYMEIETLQSLISQGNFATSLLLDIDSEAIPILKQEYKNMASITGIDDNQKTLQQTKDLMASFSGMIYGLLFFGIITGFAIIYNSSIITLSERSRELASMMVLGMTPAEVLSVITFEQWFISIFAILAGIPMTKLFLVGMAESINNDLYTMPTVLSMYSILAAFMVTVLSIWIAQRMAARKIRALSIVDVLKTKE